MIKNVPDFEALVGKVSEIIQESCEPESLDVKRPLMAEQGLDSLDLIETSFSMQEFFGFEFSDKNALEELERILGDQSIVGEDGALTTTGREMAFKRMPELAEIDLPERLTPAELQKYYTVETFARLAQEFYLAAPETDPAGEPVEIRDFKVVNSNGDEVKLPSGDELIDAWVAETAAAHQK